MCGHGCWHQRRNTLLRFYGSNASFVNELPDWLREQAVGCCANRGWVAGGNGDGGQFASERLGITRNRRWFRYNGHARLLAPLAQGEDTAEVEAASAEDSLQKFSTSGRIAGLETSAKVVQPS